jgi:hypothetical protein
LPFITEQPESNLYHLSAAHLSLVGMIIVANQKWPLFIKRLWYPNSPLNGTYNQ